MSRIVDRRLPWATAELGLVLEHESSSVGMRVGDLVQPGLRKNPRRAHLLVSTVLGKHIPVTPDVVIDTGALLGSLCAQLLCDNASNVVVLGFAETATGLGHCVATRLNARSYVHSTRRVVPGVPVFGAFEEGHSHATDHRLLPTSPEVFPSDAPLILVDDEFSTGTTALQAVRVMHAHSPRSQYVIASLVDMRGPEHMAEQQRVADDLGVHIDSVALARGTVHLPEQLTDTVAALTDTTPTEAHRAGRVSRVEIPWPADVPDGGRHGFLRSDNERFDAAIRSAADALDASLDPDRPVIVIGHEELMYLPLRIARLLQDGGRPTWFQTTTRSPAYVLDEPGYPLRRGFRFAASETGETSPRYLYNARVATHDPQIVLIVDSPADTEVIGSSDGVASVLAAAGEDVVVAVVPGADPAELVRSRGDR
ncbi:phosphoribosyltransferase family protein [Actinomycetes bacterium M1A6_2h]